MNLNHDLIVVEKDLHGVAEVSGSYALFDADRAAAVAGLDKKRNASASKRSCTLPQVFMSRCPIIFGAVRILYSRVPCGCALCPCKTRSKAATRRMGCGTYPSTPAVPPSSPCDGIDGEDYVTCGRDLAVFDDESRRESGRGRESPGAVGSCSHSPERLRKHHGK